MESEGKKIHSLAAKAREEGRHLDALKLCDESILVYQQNNDSKGLSEVFADRSIIYRHLFGHTKDKVFLIIAKGEMLVAVEIAEKSGQKDALAMPYFQLGSVQRELGQFQEAVDSYNKAVENQTNNPSQEHNRSAVLADMKVHLATCEYRLGDKTALDRALSSLSEIEQSDEVKYNKDVWISGGYMAVAEMLKTDGLKKAKEYLQKARKIIDENPELKIRKEQLEKLSLSFQ